MNKNAISTLFTTTAIALASSAVFSEPSSANTIRYSCDTSSGTPAIVGRIADENRDRSVEMFRFPSEYFSSDEAVQTCQTTADRFQLLSKNEIVSTNSIAYYCDTSSGTPAIVGRIADENGSRSGTILNFPSQYFSSAEAVQACQTTATTLQSQYDNGSLGYLTRGLVNDRPAVCMTELNGTCDSSNMLFNLPENNEPKEVLDNMLASGFVQEGDNSRPGSQIHTDIHPRRWWNFLESEPDENDTPEYVTSGLVEDEPVICLVPKVGDTCNPSNILFKIDRKNDPNEVIENMLGIDVQGQRGSGGNQIHTDIHPRRWWNLFQ